MRVNVWVGIGAIAAGLLLYGLSFDFRRWLDTRGDEPVIYAPPRAAEVPGSKDNPIPVWPRPSCYRPPDPWILEWSKRFEMPCAPDPEMRS